MIYLVIISTTQDGNEDHAPASQLCRLACSVELNPVTISFHIQAVTQLSHQQLCGEEGGNLLANNGKSTEQERVNVVGEHSIENAQPVKVGQLSFSLSWCLLKR
jgi:hypothetical protein